jgi:dihydropyrimidinase
MPGLELRMPLLYSEGVRRGRLSLQRFVALTSTNPARIYGLYPRKGTIAPGSDADLGVWDADLMRVVAQAELHDSMDDSPFEGRTVTGWPVTTIARGDVVWDDGRVLGQPGRGRFIARSLRA